MIADNSISNVQLADVASGTLKGPASANKGDPEDLTAAQVRGLLNVAAGATAAGAAGDAFATSHPMAGHTAATTTAAGFMAAADKAKLNSATASATASTLMVRDVNGRAQVANPSANTDIANKSYVDSAVVGAALGDNSVSNAKLADVASGILKGRVSANAGDPEDLTAAQVRALLNVADGATASGAAGDACAASHPGTGGAAHAIATATAAGFMAAADKAKLNAAAASATASTLMLRDANGRAQVADPSANTDIATKSYVDAAVTGGAPADNGVSNAKLADVASSTLKGRVSANAGDPEDLTAAQVPALLNVADGATAAGAAGDACAASHPGTGGAAHAIATATGFMAAGDKAKLNAATASATASTLMLRDANGRAQVPIRRPTPISPPRAMWTQR